MKNHQREIRRKLRGLRHAEETGTICKTCPYFGIGRASFYRWRVASQRFGVTGLANKRSTTSSMFTKKNRSRSFGELIQNRLSPPPNVGIKW